MAAAVLLLSSTSFLALVLLILFVFLLTKNGHREKDNVKENLEKIKEQINYELD